MSRQIAPRLDVGGPGHRQPWHRGHPTRPAAIIIESQSLQRPCFQEETERLCAAAGWVRHHGPLPAEDPDCHVHDDQRRLFSSHQRAAVVGKGRWPVLPVCDVMSPLFCLQIQPWKHQERLREARRSELGPGSLPVLPPCLPFASSPPHSLCHLAEATGIARPTPHVAALLRGSAWRSALCPAWSPTLLP